MPETDYILGTQDREVARLGLQHRVWRERMLACWRRAEFRRGLKLIDVGAGPGYAAADLAEIVAPEGRVTALERSERFVESGRARNKTVDYHELDLVLNDVPVRDQDGAWCRWVLSFVSDPELVVRKISAALKPGAVFALHEYLDYACWRFIPPVASLDNFVRKTIESWNDSGGCADIGVHLPAMLERNGFRIERAEPIVFSITPRDLAWQWPKEFSDSGSARLVELGIMAQSERDELMDDLARAERDHSSRMISPIVLEVIARRTP